MQQVNFYIGFMTLEEFIKNLSGTENELYLSSHTKTQSGAISFQFVDYFLTLGEIREGKCYYWRAQTGTAQKFGGSAVDDELQKAHVRTAKLKEAIRADILAQIPGKRIVEALIAFPVDYHLLHGASDRYRYSKTTELFEIVEAGEIKAAA